MPAPRGCTIQLRCRPAGEGSMDRLLDWSDPDRLLTKLDARDRAQLVVITYRTRLAKPGPVT